MVWIFRILILLGVLAAVIFSPVPWWVFPVVLITMAVQLYVTEGRRR
ncbi:hypothetical protein H4P1_00079 (plasmid) [Variovorax sp. PBS-H4]|nr:hypothetical protein [Variovorax sp. PBS-H4]VTU41462.1 hypothetical protein H4P1_00079 [Variovorax sp. PBS-H4]